MAGDGRDLVPLVLGLLAGREMYGYEVWARLHLVEETRNMPEGLVYAALRTIERQGFAQARWVEIGAGQPRRRYYVLTPRGEAAAARHVAQRRAVRPAVRPALQAALAAPEVRR